MNTITGMIAVILSGGQSSRMGKDKGLIENDGVPWIKMLQQKLADFSLPVYISVNKQQQTAYKSVLVSQYLIADDPSLEGINGPLRGILSAFRAHPNHHIVFLPCDMPLLNREIFELWLDTFLQQYPQHFAVISKAGKRLQPLCGIYSYKALQKLEENYRQGRIGNQSMHAVVKDMLNAYILEIPEKYIEQFKNFNTPEDLYKI